MAKQPTFLMHRCTIVLHCTRRGRLETPVRGFAIGGVKPYGMDGTALMVVGKTLPHGEHMWFRVTSDNQCYLTIEGNDAAFDSREHVPCNMAQWHATRSQILRDDPAQRAVIMQSLGFDLVAVTRTPHEEQTQRRDISVARHGGESVD